MKPTSFRKLHIEKTENLIKMCREKMSYYSNLTCKYKKDTREFKINNFRWDYYIAVKNRLVSELSQL